jgi:hypothetical protein
MNKAMKGSAHRVKKNGLDDNGQKKCPKPCGLGQIHLFRGWRRQTVHAKKHACSQLYGSFVATQQVGPCKMKKVVNANVLEETDKQD